MSMYRTAGDTDQEEEEGVAVMDEADSAVGGGRRGERTFPLVTASVMPSV